MARQQRRIRFLEGLLKLLVPAWATVGATSQKRKAKEPSAGTPEKRRKGPLSGTRPIIWMILHQGGKQHKIKVLLDTGCSVPLINQETAVPLKIPLQEHQETRVIKNFEGKQVKGAGSHYTNPLLLQHHHHYSKEIFEVSPMEVEIDTFLPFWWIVKQPPQDVSQDLEIRFDSQKYRNKCTKFETADFEL